MTVRSMAVAGMFYPAHPVDLKRQLDELFAASKMPVTRPVQALVVPHAGYIYSGLIAAKAYSQLDPEAYEQVLLLGPSHRVAFAGMALPSDSAFRSPLGQYPLACEMLAVIEERGLARVNDSAHRLEHALEVQLPFLQYLGLSCPLIPVVVGNASPEQVANLIECVCLRKKTLVLISSDLSHFHSYTEAQVLDERTSQRILRCDVDIRPEEACGCQALNGLLFWLKSKGKTIDLIDQCNSGDTAGDKHRVVGYGAYIVYE